MAQSTRQSELGRVKAKQRASLNHSDMPRTAPQALESMLSLAVPLVVPCCACELLVGPEFHLVYVSLCSTLIAAIDTRVWVLSCPLRMSQLS